jgi:hypothetical protein
MRLNFLSFTYHPGGTHFFMINLLWHAGKHLSANRLKTVPKADANGQAL